MELSSAPTMTPGGHWGRNLLAGVGISLTLSGIAIVLLPFCMHTSAFVVAPGAAILAVGVLLVVMSAFFDTTGGEGTLPGWHVCFGRELEPVAERSSQAGETPDSRVGGMER